MFRVIVATDNTLAHTHTHPHTHTRTQTRTQTDTDTDTHTRARALSRIPRDRIFAVPLSDNKKHSKQTPGPMP
jgi:hypothetical protein